MKQFCPNCCQNVNTVSAVKWGPMIVGLLFGIIPGIVYWAVKRGQMCPICHCGRDDLQPPKLLGPGDGF